MTTSKILAFNCVTSRSDAYVLHEVFSDENELAIEGAMTVDQLIAQFADDAAVQEGMRDARPWIAEQFYSNEKSLKALRLQRGLSQKELADACGTSQPAIAALEAGKRDARASTIVRLAEALGVDGSELFAILTSPVEPK